MIVHNDFNYYPLELSQVISGNGEVVYDRNNRKRAFCFIDLQTNQETEIER